MAVLLILVRFWMCHIFLCVLSFLVGGMGILSLVFILSISIISSCDSFTLDNLPLDSFHKQEGKIQCFSECFSYVSTIPRAFSLNSGCCDKARPWPRPLLICIFLFLPRYNGNNIIFWGDA